MAEKLNPVLVQNKLRDKGLNLFSFSDFIKLFNKNKPAAKKFINNYIDKELFIRVKKGLFALKDNPPPPELIANKLYIPSYISLETALSNYNIIPEVVYGVTSVTTKSTREFAAMDINFNYRKIKKSAFTGYELQRKNGQAILMAVPEKALVDYLYFVVLKKISLNDRLEISKLSKNKALKYARLFNNQRLIKLIKLIWQFWDNKNHVLDVKPILKSI